jgi:hypothetical protein
MSEYSPKRKLLALGLVMGLGLSACATAKNSSTSTRPTVGISNTTIGPFTNQTYPGVILCQAEKPNEWQPLPSNMNPNAIAEAMGADPSTVEQHGEYGGANCEQGITANEAFGTKAVVQQIGTTCITIGLGSRPEANEVYHDVLAVCIPGK